MSPNLIAQTAHASGDLNGKSGTKVGSITADTENSRNNPTKTETTMAKVRLYLDRKTGNPAMKSCTDIARRDGQAAAMLSTCHFSNAANRSWRRRKASGAREILVHPLYSRKACFRMMAKKAEVSEAIRLRNHS
jgi:hypothetical protein